MRRCALCRQCALFKVLVAYAACDAAVDYVQSMADNAAILLVHLEDASAFWALVRLMQPHGRYRLRTMYTPELPRVHLLKAELEELVRKRKPHFTHRYLRLSAELYPPCEPLLFFSLSLSMSLSIINHEAAHPFSMCSLLFSSRAAKVDGKKITPNLSFAFDWIMRLFANSTPFPLTIRFWDVFLLEGDISIVTFAFTLIEAAEPLLKKETGDSNLSNLFSSTSSHTFVSACYSFVF